MPNIPPGSGVGPLRKYLGASWATILGYLNTISSNVQTQIDALTTTTPTPATLADGASITIKGLSVIYGETLAKGDIVYLATDGKVYKTDATDSTKLPNGPNIFRILTAGVLDDENTAMQEGFFRDDALAAGFSASVPFYADPATAGGITVTAPTTPAQYLQVLGAVTKTAKILHFKPTGVTVTVGRYTTPSIAASAATLTPNVDQYSMWVLTAQAEACAVAAPTGTPTHGQVIEFEFRDDGTSRTWTFNVIFVDGTGLDLLDGSNQFASTINTWAYFQAKYNATVSKWHLVAGPGGY